MHGAIAAAFLCYIVFLLAVVFFCHKKQHSSADYIVGSRGLNFWVIALSAHASDMSSWIFMALPASIFLGGLSHAWICIGLFLGMLLTWQLVAKKLRTSTEICNTYTLSSFFERKFHDDSGMIRLITALSTLFFMICYLAAGLIGMGMLLEAVFDLNYAFCLILATLVVVAYTFIGGFRAVVWTDLFQALFLLIVIVAVPVVAFNHLTNGTVSIAEAAATKGVSLQLLPSYSAESFWTIASLFFGWGLGYFGQPHIVTKFMGIDKPEELVKSKYVGLSWMIVSMTAAVCAGLVAIAYFGPDELDNPELLFALLSQQLFHPFIAGIFLCGIASATISTMGSQILICAGLFSEDLCRNLVKNRSAVAQVHVARAAVILIALTALALALGKNSSVLEAVRYAWTGLGCSFGPLVLAALYARRVNKYGAIAGLCVGSFIAAFWDQFNPYFFPYAISAMIPGVLLSSTAIFAVSYVTTRAPEIEVSA